MQKYLTILTFTILVVTGSTLRAQSFTEPNADGVDITYTPLTDSTVEVVQASYRGRIVVPETVLHDGTNYTVVQVNDVAFRNLNHVTFIQLPSSINLIGNMAFNKCSRLDTLIMNNPQPPTLRANNVGAVRMLFGNELLQTVTVIVPGGSLRHYRNAYWDIVPHIISPAAVPIVVLPRSSHITVNGVENTPENEIPTYWYEAGDTVTLYYSNTPDTIFFGWYNTDNVGDEHSQTVSHTHIVTGPDTLRGMIEEIGYDTIAVNNIKTILNACGMLSYKGGVANYHFPADSNLHSLYSAGLWVGGLDLEDSVRVCASRFYTPDYVPGPIYRATPQPPVEEIAKYNRLWSVSRGEIDNFISNVGHYGYTIPENILTWPGNHPDGQELPLAPYYDADSDGYYNPRRGDYPLIRGDRMLFGVFNDAFGHFETGGSPVGVEVHVSAYAFDEPGDTAMNNTLFLSYKIHKRAYSDLGHTYLGAWADFDIGYAYDDYIGCDVKNGMFYGYNGDEIDGPGAGAYAVPVAQGCAILGGAILPSDGVDNPRIDLEKMHQFFPDSLARYRLAGGGYDIAALTADADLYYPQAWYFSPYDTVGNCAINGLNFGNGIADDERMGMTNFTYYNNSSKRIDGEPTKDEDYYNYMQSHWKDGSHLMYGYDGTMSDIPCTFMFPGDSDPLHWGTNGVLTDWGWEIDSNWTEGICGNAPSDRRGLGGSGPFIFHYGDCQTLDLAYTSAMSTETDTSAWGAVELLRVYTASVRRQFLHDTTDSGRPFTYRPYSPIPVSVKYAEPIQPKVYPNPSHDRVTVQFGNISTQAVELYDMTGRLVRKTNCNGTSTQLSLSGLPAGVYYLRTQGITTRILKH